MTEKHEFDDELINVSGGTDEVIDEPELKDIYREKLADEGTPVADPFAPPPPKGAIFHQDDTPSESELPKWKEPYRPPHNTGVHQSINYESPVKPDRSMSNWRKIVNHPVTISLAILAVFWYYTTRSGLSWIATAIVIFIIAPYWFIRRRRYYRDYDDGGMMFDEFTHRGCLFRPFRWF